MLFVVAAKGSPEMPRVAAPTVKDATTALPRNFRIDAEKKPTWQELIAESEFFFDVENLSVAPVR